jgi:hypothetical protein
MTSETFQKRHYDFIHRFYLTKLGKEKYSLLLFYMLIFLNFKIIFIIIYQLHHTLFNQ